MSGTGGPDSEGSKMRNVGRGILLTFVNLLLVRAEDI